MSFTTDIYNSIFEDIEKKHTSSDKSTAIRLVTYSNKLKTAFAVNKNNMHRAVYLSVGSVPPKVSFPKWNGVKIDIALLPEYGSQDQYVVMSELPNSEGYIFEIVAEDLRQSVEQLKTPVDAYKTVMDVLSKWKSFFQYDGEIIMSEIRQQGLMGELLFLEKCIDEIGVYSVTKWSGWNDETHDYYWGNHAVEIKTTSRKEPYFAHISSENQLYTKDVSGKLFLKFYAFRKSQSAGKTLPEEVTEIRNKLLDSHSALVQFNDRIKKYGYHDEVANLYTTGYYIRDHFQFEIDKGFPCITPQMIQKGVSNVEYNLSISKCEAFEIKEDEMLVTLRGEAIDDE